MWALTETDQLTVYNGTEALYVEEDGVIDDLFAEGCCESSQSGVSEDFKERQRKLLNGEGFLKSIEGNPLLFWTPVPPATAIHKAVDIIKECSSSNLDLEQLLKKKLPFDEENLDVAVSLIRTFIQLNFTGPEISNTEMTEALQTLDTEINQTFQSQVQDFLQVDGIEVDSSIRHPGLLPLAKYFLSTLKSLYGAWPFYLIWSFRIDFLHQRMLTRRCWSLCKRLKFYADKYIKKVDLSSNEMGGVLEDVHGIFFCEIAEMLAFYYDGILSERILTHAKKVLDLNVEFSGKMGFRTKFQQTPKPQTVVTVTSKSSNPSPCRLDCRMKELPRSEALNDDTRLERLQLVDDVNQEPYGDAHQTILLGLLLHKQGFQSEQELKRQEEEVLINAIIDFPVHWSGRISALVARCQMEKYDRRAIDRTLRQIEEISKTISRQMDDSDDVLRQYLFFGSGHPLKSEIKMLFGEVLLSLEHWKEALRLYTDLGAFDQIVRCYEMMNLRHKAEELVREKIMETGKTSKLLVLLGDVTSDITFYEEAWSLSSEKSVDSQIRLGSYYFRREEFTKSIIHFKRVVEIAPLEYPCWIKLAWASYKTEDFETAFHAYLRAANLEYDNFQVWNNLANCALKLNRKDYALRAYKVAVKCSYDEWRVWSNILIVATELDSLTDSVQAYHRILDLNKSFIDEALLEKMVDFAVKRSKPNSIVIGSLAKLLGRITATSSRSAIVWLLYGRTLASYMDCGDCDPDMKSSNFERAMHYYDKSLALMRQNPRWKSDVAALQNVVSCIREYRSCREHGWTLLKDDSKVRLKGLDSMLRQAAMSVYSTLKGLVEDITSNDENVQLIFNDMAEEIKDPFYA